MIITHSRQEGTIFVNPSLINAPQNFEEALARLEAIAAALDRNEVPLAEALTLCAEAAELTRYCRAQLAEAEGKLERLLVNEEGEVRLEEVE